MRSQDYDKIRGAIRYWMLGKEYHLAHKAMEFGLKYHTGLRKDGKMPEFQHQVSQANFARTLHSDMLYPEETLATIFLHDVVEDCGVPISVIFDEFGSLVGNAVELMTNRHADGTKKPLADYYGVMQDCPITSVAKGCDRIHNHQTMVGVFDGEKQIRYITETEDYILPMLKAARKKFTVQEPIYQNIKHVLLTQIELVQAMHDAN